jgi:hypothetical protein
MKGKDTRAHRSPRQLPELKRRLDSTLDSRQSFNCTSTTNWNLYKGKTISIVCCAEFHQQVVFIGVSGAVNDLIKSVICQELVNRLSHVAGRQSCVASPDSRHRVPFHRLLERVTAKETHGRLQSGAGWPGSWSTSHPWGPHVSGLCTRPPCVRCILGVTLILVEFLISL